MVRSIEISERNGDNVLISGVNPTISPAVVKFMVRSIEISKRNGDNVLISGVNPTISPTAVKFFE